MKINKKQQQLIDEMLRKIKERYPEVIFKKLIPSADNPEDIWVNVLADMDEEREMELSFYSAGLSMDILMETDYDILLLIDNPSRVYA